MSPNILAYLRAKAPYTRHEKKMLIQWISYILSHTTLDPLSTYIEKHKIRVGNIH